MNSYVASILIICLNILVIHGYDSDTLCDCYSVSLTSISGVSSDQTICYTYSIVFNSENKKCQINAMNIVLGVCDTNHDETQFTVKSLQESIISINPNQDIFILSPSTESLLGLKLEMNKEKEVKLCMKNVNTDGITSENVQFILNNDDTITCYNDAKQSGLPCKSSISPIIESQKNMDYVAKYIQKDDFGHPEFERIDISNNFDELITNENDNELGKELNKKSEGISVAARSYIRFAFVAIMIFIILNVMFCVLLALRQSGALDDIKYFNNIVDVSDNNMENDNEDENNDTEDDIDDDIDEESEDTDDDDYDDVSAIYNNLHMNDISVSDLVAMRSGHSINDSNFKIMISLSKLEENQELHDQLNHIHSNSEEHPFME